MKGGVDGSVFSKSAKTMAMRFLVHPKCSL